MSATHHRRQAVAAGVLAVCGLVAISLALRPPASRTVDAEAPGRTGSSRLVDIRRFPGAVADAVGAQRLEAQLERIAGPSDGCWLVDDAGMHLVEHEPDAPRRPASTLKMVTAAAVLAALGPQHRFTTTVLGDDPARARRVALVGGGDPGLATPAGIAAVAGDPERRGSPTTSLAELAQRVADAGVRALPDGIVVDDGRYDAVRYNDRWPDSYRATGQVGPVGALAVDGGWTDPAGRRGTPEDPALATGRAFARLLEDRGVRVGPVTRGGATPGSRTIARIESAPLDDVVSGMLASSNNHGAEMLLKEVAVRGGVRPGTTAAGAERALSALRRAGVTVAGLAMLDGSGLSRDDRASCRTLLGVLALGDRPRYRSLRDGLAIAGERGTLAPRLGGSALRGRLIAKTGTLDGTSGLVGTTRVRRPVRFALLLNGSFDEPTAYARREAMATAIAGFPDAPAPETLVPVPGAP